MRGGKLMAAGVAVFALSACATLGRGVFQEPIVNFRQLEVFCTVVDCESFSSAADQLIMTQGTVDYYKRVMEKMGGREKTMQFARLFLVPAQGHGGTPGGVDPIIKWVEDGIAPEKIINRTQTGTRPLFPYPELAKYKGTGSTDDAASFESYIPK